MDTNDKIVGTVLGLNEKEYRSLVKNGMSENKAALIAAESALIFHADSEKHEIVDLTDLTTDEKREFVKQYFNNKEIENCSYLDGDPRLIDSQNRAQNHLEYLPIETREATVKKVKNQLKEEQKKNPSKVKTTAAILATACLAGLAGAGAVKLVDRAASNDAEIETQIDDNTDVDAQGYGLYNFDLSEMEDMSEYETNLDILNAKAVEEKYGISGVTQKDRALLRLNILKEFNNEITLTDGTTKQIGGLTTEQLVAIDAYSNSNIYTKEDYIKNFGLYDFENVSKDFTNGSLAVSSYLANPEVDGKCLADIFQDEEVKENYLKQLEYRDAILNAKTDKDQKKAISEYKEFLEDCSIDQSSDSYLDYSNHPGMAFVTSTMVNALNYHNIPLGKAVSDIIIIGNDESQTLSKLNTICANANQKLDDAIKLKDTLEIYIPIDTNTIKENNNIEIENAKELELAAKEKRTPMLKETKNLICDSEMYTLITEVLCDQGQINELTDKTLQKENKLVTVYDQEAISKDAVQYQIKLLEAGKGYYKDAQTAALASQLIKPGDTATITEKGLNFNSDEAVKQLEQKAPSQTQAAKDALNQKEGMTDTSTDEKKSQFEGKINNDKAQTAQEGVNYYNSVVSYYEKNGDVSGIPSELQSVYNNLGESTYNMAKQTGIAKYMTNSEHKQSGGETTIDKEFKDTETSKTETSPVPSVDNRTENNVTPTPVPTPEPTPTPTPTPTPVPGNNGGDINDEFKDAKIDGDLIYVPKETTTNEGFSNEAPSNFAPVVEDMQTTESSNNYFTPDELDEIIKNMDDKELAELTATESLEETNEMVKTK